MEVEHKVVSSFGRSKVYGHYMPGLNGEPFKFYESRSSRIAKKHVKRALLRMWLPYGKWVCDSGRVVLFNRDYQPIWERKDNITQRANPDEWLEDIQTSECYYKDGTSPWTHKPTFQLCLAVLKDFGVSHDEIIAAGIEV